MFTLFLEAAVVPPGSGRALRFTPDRAHDPFLDDGRPPANVTQAYFESLGELEAAVASLPAGSAEAMRVHRFDVPQPWQRAPGSYCTYLVAYAGPAEDERAWLDHYLTHHPPLMAELPGIRELEIYTPLDWRCPPHLTRLRHLQRNKVAFDSRQALEAALASPVRTAMRADFARFPPYTGRVTHFAMTTEVLR